MTFCRKLFAFSFTEHPADLGSLLQLVKIIKKVIPVLQSTCILSQLAVIYEWWKKCFLFYPTSCLT